MSRTTDGPARLPRLRTLLLLLTVVVMTLPVGGLWLLRLYESALIRQTEVELVAQAAVLAAAYKVERRHLTTGGMTTETDLPVARDPDADSVGSRLTRATGLDLAIDPVRDPPPAPIAPLAPAAELARQAGAALSPVLADTKLVTLAAIRLADRSGVIVATTGDDLGQSLSGLDEVRRALSGEPVSVMRRRETSVPFIPGSLNRGAQLRVFVAFPVVEDGHIPGVVLVSRTPRDLFQALYGKRAELLTLLVFLLATGFGLTLFASRAITLPLGRLVSHATRIADGETSTLPILGGTRELATLSLTIGKMARTLENRADYIRGFAAHVSHEFKTPLAGIKGAAELLHDHTATMSEADRCHFLGLITSGIERLDRLVIRLLSFARADMMRPLSPMPVVLAPILEVLAANYAGRGLTVTVSMAGFMVPVTADAIEIIFVNLLDNALRHGGPGTIVSISADTLGGITIADSGAGISKGNAARVFEPFFTTKRDSGGTGLGLPIVRAIMISGGGGIELLTHAPEGAAFRIWFAA